MLLNVRCGDGVVRNPQPFTTRRQAHIWAEWGHCCTTQHNIETAETGQLILELL